MFDRAALHNLVEALPEEALDFAFRVLEHYQKHPPSNESDPEKLRAKARNRVMRSTRLRAKRTGASGTSLLAGCVGPDGYGSATAQGWEGQTCLVSKVCFYRGHELHTVDRLSLSEDGCKLLYAVEAKILDGAVERHQFSFDVAGKNSSLAVAAVSLSTAQ
ncbi:MAG: hypothetical protein ABSG16_10360 [Candidatus Acidiferrum sp.]|jgi:hypothetical protein